MESGAQLTVTVPAAYVAGPVPIIVTNPDGAEATSEEPYTYVNAPEPVTLLRLEPQGASIVGGTAVTILGTGFAEVRRSTFGGQPASGLQRLSSRTLVVGGAAGHAGESEVTVTVPGQSPVSTAFEYAAVPSSSSRAPARTRTRTAWTTPGRAQYGLVAGDPSDGGRRPDHDGLTSAQECQAGSHPRSHYSRYLAEGATGAFFDTRIAIANPNASAARVLLRFQTDTGRTVREFLVVPAMARRTIDCASAAWVGVGQRLDGRRVGRAGRRRSDDALGPGVALGRPRRDEHAGAVARVVPRRGRHARGLRPVLPAAEPEPTQTAQVQIRYLLPSGAPIVQTVTSARTAA